MTFSVYFLRAFFDNDVSESDLPEFAIKSNSERNLLPHSFLMKSISSFVGKLEEERLICYVKALRFYLCSTSDVFP